jgi:hypothetical protein
MRSALHAATILAHPDESFKVNFRVLVEASPARPVAATGTMMCSASS